MPLVSPMTSTGLIGLTPVFVSAPAMHVAINPVMDAPPFDAGALKAILALVFPAVATGFIGAPGTVATGSTDVVALHAPTNSAYPTVAMIFKVCLMIGVDGGQREPVDNANVRV